MRALGCYALLIRRLGCYWALQSRLAELHRFKTVKVP